MAIESSQSLAEERAALARGASKKVAMLSTSQKNEALLRIAAILDADGASVLEANAQDLAAAAAAGLEKWFVERLTLSPERVADISSDIRDVAELPDPVGETFDSRTLPNGLLVGRRRVPLGVIGCIYESRPNVTVDMAALALKSGNACVLRGGKEAVNSNRVLGAVIHSALEDVGVPTDAVQVITDPDRAHVDDLLKSHDLIDLMIPRGGAGLITHIRDNATMPVVAGGIGVVH
ncbi:MAG TPA: aldehyde dehydrogenase family protein, partial [Dehalococcoidia bacterium]|nr:aldehyde dehydrogenase family protein [Dehalococcoidia bacterium]